MPFGQMQAESRPVNVFQLMILLIISIILVVVYSHEDEDGLLHSVQRSFSGITHQVGGTTAIIGSIADNADKSVEDLTANPATMNALREQNEQLRQMLASAEEYRLEVQRLQGLLNMKKVSGVEGPIAHIIGRSNSAWDRSIIINLGANEGIQTGMTVMGSTGVIGQVSQVQAHTASVRLLNDPNSGAAVMIQSSRKDGIVKGSITGLLYLENLDEDVIPSEGDVIVTSGLGGSYERGLIVGSVVSVNKTINNPTGAVVVNPNDTASLLEEVIVVFSSPDVEAAEKKAEEERAKKEALQNNSA